MRNLCLLSLLTVLLAVSGCAPRVVQFVYDDGTPAPTTIYMERNFQTGISVEAYVARIVVEENEDSSRIVPAEYLRLGINEFQELPKDTFAIGGKIRIINPNERSYTLFVVYKLDYKEEGWPYWVSRVLYMGNSKDETFSVRREIEPANPRVNMRIAILEDESHQFREEKVLFDFETAFIRK